MDKWRNRSRTRGGFEKDKGKEQLKLRMRQRHLSVYKAIAQDVCLCAKIEKALTVI